LQIDYTENYLTIKFYSASIDMNENLSPSPSENNNRLRNILIALTAITLSVAVFFSLQSQGNAASLETQAKQSVPLETALSNGKPTLMEFYADWCATCQAMAADLAKVKQQYGDRVNFTMLNVDNDKWLPEVMRYRVDGIPHFVYFNDRGENIAEAIGEQPISILKTNLDATIANLPPSDRRTIGTISEFQAKVNNLVNDRSDPRSHGAQVK
jgi:thiol-disulfide isomerase/thioredoxin